MMSHSQAKGWLRRADSRRGMLALIDWNRLNVVLICLANAPFSMFMQMSFIRLDTWNHQITILIIYFTFHLGFISRKKKNKKGMQRKRHELRQWRKPALRFWDHLEIYQITFSYLLSPDITHAHTHVCDSHTQSETQNQMHDKNQERMLGMKPWWKI